MMFFRFQGTYSQVSFVILGWEVPAIMFQPLELTSKPREKILPRVSHDDRDERYVYLLNYHKNQPLMLVNIYISIPWIRHGFVQIDFMCENPIETCWILMDVPF